MAKSMDDDLRSLTTCESRSKVPIFTLPGFAVTSAVPMALLSVITALTPVWACRYALTWPIACCGLLAAFGVDRISSVQAGPWAGAAFVEHVEPTPSP